MRRQNHIVLIGQRRGERIAGLLGLDGEYVHGRAGKMPGIKMPFQRIKVGDEAAGQVDEDCILLHVGKLVVTEKADVRLAPIDMQGDHVGLFQQLVERAAAMGIAHGELLFDVVEHHTHTESLGDDGKLGADIAITDDAQRLAAYLM